MSEETVNPIHELRDAVDALTKPVVVGVFQREVESTDRNARPEGIRRREDECMLEQLRHAISNSLGAGGGAGKSARERTPLDVGAFTLYEDIDGRVRSWLSEAGKDAAAHSTPGEALRAWFAVWTRYEQPDGLVHSFANILHGWKQAIDDILDPPTKQEITAPCPVCGQMWVTVGKGEDQESVRALWAVWRENQDLSFGTCRACDKVWHGVGMMRKMRIAIDDAEQARGLTA